MKEPLSVADYFMYVMYDIYEHIGCGDEAPTHSYH
jgi:hypothetical protein